MSFDVEAGWDQRWTFSCCLQHLACECGLVARVDTDLSSPGKWVTSNMKVCAVQLCSLPISTWVFYLRYFTYLTHFALQPYSSIIFLWYVVIISRFCVLEFDHLPGFEKLRRQVEIFFPRYSMLAETSHCCKWKEMPLQIKKSNGKKKPLCVFFSVLYVTCSNIKL